MSKNPFDDISKRFEQLTEASEDLHANPNTSFDQLFNHGFLSKHTNGQYSTIDDFVNAAGFGEITFKEIPDEPWDNWVHGQTDFPNWQEMLNEASRLHVLKKLGF